MSASRTLGRYFPGALVKMQATFTSTDYVTPADPSTIVLRLVYPGDSAASMVACWAYATGMVGSLARVGTGAYYLEITASVYGDHYFNFLGTGGVQADDEWHFEVRHSKFVL